MKSHRFTTEPQLLTVEAGTTLIKMNSKGRGVAMIQIVLRNLGFPMPRSFKNRTADGIFGAETDQAVKSYQREHMLSSDGIVGKKTLANLDDLLVAQPCFDSASPVIFSAEVRATSVVPEKFRLVSYT
jgi:peptidoglycan hydrolase-like protein with peptidoglycan-binding domain